MSERLHEGLFKGARATMGVAAEPGTFISYTNKGPNTFSWMEPRVNEWLVVGPWDTRGYRFCIQWVRGDRRGIMVRVGCRFKTLDAAFKHWHKKAIAHDFVRAYEGQQALACIMLALGYAKSARLPGTARKAMKFDFAVHLLNRRK